LVADLDQHGNDLIDGLLVYDPASRTSAKQAVQSPYFTAYGYIAEVNGITAVNGGPNGFHA
jgi:hypothetical protein